MAAAFTLRRSETTLRALDRLAEQTERSRSCLAAKAIEGYIALNAWQITKIEAGIAAADRGAFADDDYIARSRKIFGPRLKTRWTRRAGGRTRLGDASRPRDDRLQERDVAGEGRPALRARLDGGARAPGDERLGHFDIARARQMIEMRAEIAVGRAGQALEPGEVEALVAGIAARSAPP